MTESSPAAASPIGAGHAVAVADAVLAAPARLGEVRVLAVDGPSGSGKSTVAALIAAELAARGRRVAVLPTDDVATWDDPASWWSRVRDEVIEPLRRGRPGRYRRTEWISGTPRSGAWVDVPVPEVLIIEGVTAGRRSVRAWLSLLLWVEIVDPGVRLAAAISRDGPENISEMRSWQEFESGWFAVDDPSTHADHRLLGRAPGILTSLVEVVSDTSG